MAINTISTTRYTSTYEAKLSPSWLSTTITGEGESPEQARVDAERKRDQFMREARGHHGDQVVMINWGFLGSNYLHTQSNPRMAKRLADDKALPADPRSLWRRFLAWVSGS